MEVLNNLFWLDLLRDNLENAAEKAYRIHKLNQQQDYKYISNKKISIAVAESKLIKDNFPIDTNGFHRPVPLGVENAELDIFRFTDEPVVDTVKQTLGLDHCLVVYNLQKPGKVYNTHIDYNRRFIKQLPDTIAKTVKAKDIKKYIWFIQDQQIGQMFAVGRQCLSWQAGDIFCLPWYMPHGTANASNINRPLLMICGI